MYIMLPLQLLSAKNEQRHGNVCNLRCVLRLQSPASLVILDNIERLVEYVPIGPRFSNSLLQIILELLEKQPPKGRKLMVFGTSSDAEVMKNLGIAKAFTVVVNVPLLSEEEMQQVFLELHAFHPQEVSPLSTHIYWAIGLLIGVNEVWGSHRQNISSCSF